MPLTSNCICPILAFPMSSLQCVNNAGNIFYQLGNIALLLSTAFEDLFYLRFWLSVGFLMMMVWALMGVPAWGQWWGIGMSVCRRQQNLPQDNTIRKAHTRLHILYNRNVVALHSSTALFTSSLTRSSTCTWLRGCYATAGQSSSSASGMHSYGAGCTGAGE